MLLYNSRTFKGTLYIIDCLDTTLSIFINGISKQSVAKIVDYYTLIITKQVIVFSSRASNWSRNLVVNKSKITSLLSIVLCSIQVLYLVFYDMLFVKSKLKYFKNVCCTMTLIMYP